MQQKISMLVPVVAMEETVGVSMSGEKIHPDAGSDTIIVEADASTWTKRS